MSDRRPRWRRIVAIAAASYAVLTLASFIVTSSDTPLPTPPQRDGAATTPVFTSVGELADDRTAEVAYLRWPNRAADPAHTVILLHGSPGDAGQFSLLATHLADAGFSVIAPDMPGFGASTRRVPSYAPRAHARYVLALMDELGVERAHMLGFSMGSAVMLEIRDLAPDRVSSFGFYGGVGIMEGEGSGDYHFEQLKYATLWGIAVIGPELIPHFGLLDGTIFGDRVARHAFARNFLDSDFRPYRAMLEQADLPAIVLHGRGDFLVHDWVAETHHELLPRSELVMFDDGHFMLFESEPAAMLAEHYNDFLTRIASEPETYTGGEITDHSQGRREVEVAVPFGETIKSISPWWQTVVIALATLISEDATAVGVGLFVWLGKVDLAVGIFGTCAGIFFGDMGLYLLGRVLGRRVLRWKAVRGWMPSRSIDSVGEFLTRRGAAAIFMSRCIPGTRLPLYLVAGVTRANPWTFALWTFIAGAVWTPLVVGLTFLIATAIGPALTEFIKFGFFGFFILLAICVLTMHVLMQLTTRRGRQTLDAQITRLVKHEFWPTWIFYAPIMPALAWLAIRHRSLTVWTLANPGLPDGGVVGESKQAIVDMIPRAHRLDGVLVDAIEPDPKAEHRHRVDEHAALQRAERARTIVAEQAWRYPVIAKPDASQRGAGVNRIDNPQEFDTYFAQIGVPVQVQAYHPGPHECGVFYVRMPDQDRGRIFSITHKVFRELVGDGERDLDELIWNDRRCRVQRRVFLDRFAEQLERIPGAGERIRVCEAGNHAQGCVFTDGEHLRTPALEASIDRIAHAIPGFYFGRFDLRYADPEALANGEGFKIIELNGVTSESTNMYDPSWSVFRAWATLIRQWNIAFRIGAMVRAREGLTPPSVGHLLAEVRRFYKEGAIDAVSD